MHRFRFVHAADLHLDTPFRGLTRVSPEVAAALRDASLQAFDGLVDLTLRTEAAFLVLAGDIYDGADRGIRAQLRFHAGVARLSHAGVPVFIVHGNHDPLDGWSAIHAWPEGVTVFASDEPGTCPVMRGGRRLAFVHGISYPTRDVTENLALRFRPSPSETFQVGVLHCSVGGVGEHAPYSPCSVEDLVGIGYDYWALGHVHRRRVLREAGPTIAYSGNLQGRSPHPGECGPKGALVVDVEGSRVTSTRFAALDRVRFENVPVDVAGCADVVEVRRALVAAGTRLLEAPDGVGRLVRIHLTGASPVHRDLRRDGVLDELYEELRAHVRRDEPLLDWIGLVDETSIEADLGALRERSDFVGATLRLAEAAGADASRRVDLVARVSAALDAEPGRHDAEAVLEAARGHIVRALT